MTRRAPRAAPKNPASPVRAPRSASGARVAALERRIFELEHTVRLLDEARSHYADQYDFSPFGCLTLDERGCILQLNVTAAKMLGRSRSQLTGVPLLPFIAKDDIPAFLHHLRQCRNSREKVTSELALGPRGGLCRLIEMLSMPVSDVTSDRIVFRTALHDITLRRRAEEELRQSEARFSTAFRASPSAIAISSVEEGRFIDVNDAFCKLLGRTRADVLAHTAIDLGFHPDASTRDDHIAALRQFGTLRNIESSVRVKSGALVDLLTSAELIQIDGRDCILVIAQDLSEIKALQRHVLEISDREQARIGQDLHDGPCQTITGAAILSEVAARELRRAASPLAGDIREISRLLREGIEDVRRLAAGLFPVKIERHGLAWALRELAAEASRSGDVECKFSMPTPIVIGDENAAIHLYRIVQEAVSNALRHGHAKSVLITLRSRGDDMSLCVSDDGIGPPRHASKRRGLGIHTMRYRASMLGGILDIAPAGRRGTTVTCSFPRSKLTHADEHTVQYETYIPG